MESMSRRKFLACSAAAATGAALLPRTAAAAEAAPTHDNAKAILYDATRCIGCRSCERRCRQKIGGRPVPGELNGVRFDMPRDLSPNDVMVIMVRRTTDPKTGAERWSFMKRNCMHCNIPACASACPVAALQKTDEGPVVYHEDRCIGCRYCLLACPYTVPRYEWRDRKPRVRKCDLNGACVDACPTGALQRGKRRELIAEAHRRIDAEPERYVAHVYGEHEAGGGSYLFLSSVPFEEFGLPRLPPVARTAYSEPLMGGLPGWIIGLGLFLGGLYQLHQRQLDREQKLKDELGGLQGVPG